MEELRHRDKRAFDFLIPGTCGGTTHNANCRAELVGDSMVQFVQQY